MNIVILSARTGWHTDELCRALAERQHSSRVLPYEGLVARFGMTGDASLSLAGPNKVRPTYLSSESVAILDADAVMKALDVPGRDSLDQIIYPVSRACVGSGRVACPLMNSPRRALGQSVPTTALLQEAGLPTPETVVCERTDEAMAAIQAMLGRGGDVIIKPIFGSMGHGLVRVGDPDVAFRVLRSTRRRLRTVFYVQRAVDHGGRDVRAVPRRRPGPGRKSSVGALGEVAPQSDRAADPRWRWGLPRRIRGSRSARQQPSGAGPARRRASTALAHDGPVFVFGGWPRSPDGEGAARNATGGARR